MPDGSIRGEVPPNLWKMFTLTFNPRNSHHWLKARFFDCESPNIFAATTNYTCNEWLDASDKAYFKEMRITNPKYYQTAGLGDWGVVSGHIFDMLDSENLYNHELPTGYNRYIAIDYGTNNPTVFLDIYHIEDKHYVKREYYHNSEKTGRQKTNSEYLQDLLEFIGNTPATIIIDPSAASFKIEMKKAGLKIRNADNEVLEEIRHTSNLFAAKRLLIHQSCKIP